MVDEDYMLYARGKSIPQIVQQVFNQYTEWNARIGDGLSILFSLLPIKLFNAINSVAIMVFFLVIILIGRMIATKKLVSKIQLTDTLSLIAVFLLFTFLMPGVNQVFFWRTGAANYLYPTLLYLLWSIPLIKLLLGQNIFLRIKTMWLRRLVYILYILSGLVVGHGNENVSPILVAAIVPLIIYALRKNYHSIFWLVPSFITLLIGTLLLLLGPSTQKRIAHYETVFGNKSSIEAFIGAVPNTISLLWPILAISVGITLLIALSKRSKNTDASKRIVWAMGISFLAAALSSAILGFSPYQVDRAYFFSHFVLIIPLIASLYLLKGRLIKILLVVASVVLLSCMPYYKSEWQHIRNYASLKHIWIENIKKELRTQNEVSVTRIPAYSSRFLYVGFPDQEAERVSIFLGKSNNAITISDYP